MEFSYTLYNLVEVGSISSNQGFTINFPIIDNDFPKLTDAQNNLPFIPFLIAFRIINIMSDASTDTQGSKNSNVSNTTVDEDEWKELASVSHKEEVRLQDNLCISEDIKKFRTMCRAKVFNIESTWEGARIPDMPAKELEMSIHSERVNEIVRRMISKIETVGYLPFYLQNNAEVLRKYLPKQQVDEVVHIIERSKKKASQSTIVFSKKDPSSISAISSKRSRKDTASNVVQLIPYMDADFDKILMHLTRNKCLAMFQRRFKVPLSDPVSIFISLTKRLMRHLMDNFQVTAELAFNKQNRLRLAFQEYNDRMKLVEKLEEILQEKDEEFNVKMKDKEAAIREYKYKIRRIRKQFKVEVDTLINDSELEMMKSEGESSERQEYLAEEAALAQQRFNACIEDHLAIEKVLRSKRYKIETQLASWVNKYDQEIGDRQEQLDNLTEGMDNERLEYIELQCLFKEQEEVYKKYKVQKEDEDVQNFARKYIDFRQRWATVRIQRFWRAYRLRKIARRKAKKDKAKARAAKKGRK